MTPGKTLDGFIAKFSPSIAALGREVLRKMRARLPGAFELVYDNYNALGVGFAPGERTGGAIFSIALYPKSVSLFFLQAAKLKDPKKLLKGEGKFARHIVLESAADLDLPGVRALMTEAIRIAKQPIDPNGEGGVVIKSVSKAQRPRRPAGEKVVRVKKKVTRHPGRRPK